jgi:thioredoxin 1
VAEVKELTEETFDAAVSTGVAVVDFWATWCGPCKMMGALLDGQIAPALDASVTIGKVNIDAQTDLAVRFAVQSVPTLLIFKDGEERARLTGLQKPQEVIDAVRAVL